MGDIRMIHDPMASRRRALLFGLVAVVLLAAGAGILAWLQPDARAGQAPILRTRDDQLLVQIGEKYHPVPNLASARLVVSAPAEPATVGASALADMPLGAPVGILDAPGFLASASPTPLERWAACFVGENTEFSAATFPTVIDSKEVSAGEVVVLPEHGGRSLGPEQAVLARVDGVDWLITAEGRTELNGENDERGRILRRELGIDAATPVWRPPVEWINAVPKLAPLRFPDPMPNVIDTDRADGRSWAFDGEAVAPLTRTQTELLVAAGAQRERGDADRITVYPTGTVDMELPEHGFDFLDFGGGWVCATDDSVIIQPPDPATVQLPGKSVASRFGRLPRGGVGVDTGSGYQVVSATGQRHEVADRSVLDILGVGVGARAPWGIVRLLPEGTVLSRDAALTSLASR